jgi:hypothetical protein
MCVACLSVPNFLSISPPLCIVLPHLCDICVFILFYVSYFFACTVSRRGCARRSTNPPGGESALRAVHKGRKSVSVCLFPREIIIIVIILLQQQNSGFHRVIITNSLIPEIHINIHSRTGTVFFFCVCFLTLIEISIVISLFFCCLFLGLCVSVLTRVLQAFLLLACSPYPS